MRNASNAYFEEIISMCTIFESAAKSLNSLLGSFSSKKLQETIEELSAASERAYAKKCSLETELYADFITPIEREDIINIVCEIESAVRGFLFACRQMKIWGITRSKGDAIEFSDVALRCTAKIKKISYEFEKFRKNKNIRTQMRDTAELARGRDALYVSAMSTLASNSSNLQEVLAWSKIYDSLDTVCRGCECVCNAFSAAILKNI